MYKGNKGVLLETAETTTNLHACNEWTLYKSRK